MGEVIQECKNQAKNIQEVEAYVEEGEYKMDFSERVTEVEKGQAENPYARKMGCGYHFYLISKY